MSEFVEVPAGSFLMGSEDGQDDESPVHEVEVDTFEMAIYPVTRYEYAAFLDNTGHHVPRDWYNPIFSNPNFPAIGISWDDAQSYCAWLSNKRFPVRLPTEAEWERAARGLQRSLRYPWGNKIPEWIPNNGRGPLEAPWIVSLGNSNDFGIYGITANIHEWCEDWHSHDYYGGSPVLNPRGPTVGSRRVSRGGSWRHAFTISRTAARSKINPTFRYTDYGFRLVRSEI